MMYLNKEVTTETYNIDFGFRVEIAETKDEFSAFIYHPNYGIKSLMFGWPKYQPADGRTWTKEEFIDLVEGNLYFGNRYLQGYIEEVMRDEYEDDFEEE